MQRQYKCYCKSQRFSSAGEQTIYIKIKTKLQMLLQFDSTFSVTMTYNAKKKLMIELCDIVEGNKINLTQNNLTILDGLDSKLYAFSYYSSERMLPRTVIHFQLLFNSPSKKNYNLGKNYQRVK
jgi:hypothetical protein